MRWTLLLFAFAIPFITNGQLLDPVKWKTSVEHLEGQTYQITFHGTIDEGWSTYSQDSDPSGPIPTSLNFDEGDHFFLIGKTIEKGKKKEGPEPLFDNVIVGKYSGTLDLIQKIEVTDNEMAITGYLNYMACDAEKCTPPTDFDFEIVIEAPAEETTADVGSSPAKGGTQSVDEVPTTSIADMDKDQNGVQDGSDA